MSYALIHQIGMPLLIFTGITAAALIARKLALRGLHRWALRTTSTMDDAVVAAVRAPSIYWSVAIGPCLLAEAYKTSQTLMEEGDAKAFRIYGQAYRQDVEFFEFMRTMEVYKKALDKETTLVLSPDSDFLKYLK